MTHRHDPRCKPVKTRGYAKFDPFWLDTSIVPFAFYNFQSLMFNMFSLGYTFVDPEQL
jgi:hypothetical protein